MFFPTKTHEFRHLRHIADSCHTGVLEASDGDSSGSPAFFGMLMFFKHVSCRDICCMDTGQDISDPSGDVREYPSGMGATVGAS